MLRLLGAFAALCLFGAAGCADAAQRTFVSTNGNDSSVSCSLASPCRSFTKAIMVTDTNGEIVALDSGGYGRVTIDRSVSIIAPPGIYAGISVFSGENGIDVNTPGVTVVLRGLFINGQGGDIGIHFVNGAELHVDGCTISHLQSYGINASAGTMYVHDTSIHDNGGSGILLNGGNANLDRLRIEKNGTLGINVIGTARVAVRDSFIVDNLNIGLSAVAGPLTRIDVESTTIANNAVGGVVVSGSVGNKAEVTLNRGTIARNGEAADGDGVSASGTVHVSVSDSTVSGNFRHGIAAFSGATIVVTDNVVTKNAVAGFSNSSSTFNSRGNNTVQDNFIAPNIGPVTPAGVL